MRDPALTKAINRAGGAVKLGSRLGISSQAVSQWKRCPPERVLQVEDATNGEVARHELRPDLYPPLDAPSPDQDRPA
ncbi:Cro/CI family transcriptional regulator [Azospirillum sp. Marseille-Q6669]